MLKSIIIKNFRCLRDVAINFENTQTLIVGENDAGKTSLIDVLRILFDGKSIEVEDFSYGQIEINFTININERIYKVKYFNNNGSITSETKLELSHAILNNILETINLDDFTEERSFKDLREIAKLFNITVRSNSRFDSLKDNIIRIINEKLSGVDPSIVDSSLPFIKIYILDGKHMEDISLFVNERYFKDKRNNIWDERIDESNSLEQFINNKLDEYSMNIKKSIDDNGITEKIQEFLPELSDIKIKSTFTRRDINIGVNVLMLDGDEEILISKKGDGTKRRITLALLGLDDTNDNNPGIYVFDEVDTHLHVKAQKELMLKLSDFYKQGNQIILTSHSPFIINTVKPNQIRSIVNTNNSSRVYTIDNIPNIDDVLSGLGIENTYLFFAKKIVLVEGKTEEVFLPRYFELNYRGTFYSNLIKVINVDGIRNIPGFARALLELNSKNNIYILIDNDIEQDTQDILNQLDLDEDNIYKIGTSEFEDEFSSECIYNAWKNYVESNRRMVGDKWNITLIEECRNDCIKNHRKFSKELRRLNINCVEKLTKPNLGMALAEYCSSYNIPEQLKRLFVRLSN